eukprot:3970041-Pyramimonas_sp.AAC.1
MSAEEIEPTETPSSLPTVSSDLRDGSDAEVADASESGTHSSSRPTLKYGVKSCRVPGCSCVNLSNSSRYCFRHRICEEHLKVRLIKGLNFFASTRFVARELFDVAIGWIQVGTVIARRQLLFCWLLICLGDGCCVAEHVRGNRQEATQVLPEMQ